MAVIIRQTYIVKGLYHQQHCYSL